LTDGKVISKNDANFVEPAQLVVMFAKKYSCGELTHDPASNYEWYSIQFTSEQNMKMIIIPIVIKELHYVYGIHYSG
jgi:hypothetical protein